MSKKTHPDEQRSTEINSMSHSVLFIFFTSFSNLLYYSVTTEKLIQEVQIIWWSITGQQAFPILFNYLVNYWATITYYSGSFIYSCWFEDWWIWKPNHHIQCLNYESSETVFPNHPDNHLFRNKSLWKRLKTAKIRRWCCGGKCETLLFVIPRSVKHFSYKKLVIKYMNIYVRVEKYNLPLQEVCEEC